MNNDLEQFSEERLIFYRGILAIDFGGNSKIDIPQSSMLALVNIALSVKQAKPVGHFSRVNGDGIWFEQWTDKLGVPLYTTPQPAHTERDGWKLVPIEPTQEMVDAHISGMQSAGFSRAYRDMLAAAPKPESE